MRGKPWPGKHAMAILMVALVAFLSLDFCEADDEGPDFYDLKCSACCSIVAELERNLEIEKPRMNVDLRRTLGPGGNQGKKIDYAVSELRTLEVLEGLCPGMKQYGITTMPDGTSAFQRYNVGGGSVHIGHMKLGGNKFHYDQTKVEGYCYEVVEEHEEYLSEAIRAAGLAKKARAEEEARVAKAKRKGLDVDEVKFNPYEALELEPPADGSLTLNKDDAAALSRVKMAYRKLSKRYHPDKSGGDTEAVKKFVAVAKAYEALTGEELTPYGDLYRQVCIDMTDVCESEAQVEKMKFFFPRYIGSEKFGSAAGGGLDEAEANSKERKKQKKREERQKRIDAGEDVGDEEDDNDDDAPKKRKKRKKSKKKKSKKAKSSSESDL